MSTEAGPPRRARSGGPGFNQPSVEPTASKRSGRVKVKSGHGQLSHVDLLVLRELLSDLIADPHGELVGARILTPEEGRAIGNLELAIEASRSVDKSR